MTATSAFELSACQRRGFGALTTLRLRGQPDRRLTLQEASILARALAALAGGRSREPHIYMSPIASDQDFEARARADGIVIVAEGHAGVTLDWTETRALAEALRTLAESA
ncbi:MAG: hypothetical protein ACR652_00150 [Methylocystis sp.]|uniref:hypothetical protein n=1 Tax=Methylocystis sp. TaxID=1911079 RepID=UPI003DA338AA